MQLLSGNEELNAGKVRLLGLLPSELIGVVERIGGTPADAIKLSTWLYRKRIVSLSEINNIGKKIIGRLNRNYEVGRYGYWLEANSADGTVKHVYRKGTDEVFESIYMPTSKRNTLCISTQSGCRMGCRFCKTGAIGFRGNLSAADMLNQLLGNPNAASVNRIVLMGMGEPLDNFNEVERLLQILTQTGGVSFGGKNITLSTVGLREPLERLLCNPNCNLAVSLHSPFPDERKELIPAERTNSITDIVALLRSKPLPKPLRLSFEYVALSGINLSEQHAAAIADLLTGLTCHLNIIPWNSHASAYFATPTDTELGRFCQWLNRYGMPYTIRQSMGNDIGAACGQLAGTVRLSG